MFKLLIIADDFTGALDTGVQFANLGAQTMVATNHTIDDHLLDDQLEVLVLNTESRHLPADEAYTCVKKHIAGAKACGVSYIYKKVDSALRGNISHEIKALLDLIPHRQIPFVPAHPRIGRTVKNGCLYIDGVPVAQSVFGQDPYEPVQESNILKRLQEESGINAQLVQSLRVDEVGPTLLLFDCESLEAMGAITDYLADRQWLSVTIGCAGFGEFLAQTMFAHQTPTEVTLTKPLIVICGSINPITIQQVLYAESKGIQRVSLTPHQLLEPHYWDSEGGREEIHGYLTAAKDCGMLIFETFNDQAMSYLSENTEAQGGSDLRFKIGQALGDLSRQLLEHQPSTTLLMTGGDTLYQSMKVLDVTQIKPIAEISPGVVFSELSWQDQTINVITKSGGFGNKEILVDLKERIEKEKVHKGP